MLRARWRGSWAGGLAGLCLGAVSAGAQASVAAQVPDTIRGLAYDSLGFRGLAGALITAEPGGETAVTDSLGRFLIVSPQRVTRLVAFHDRADRLGFGELVADRPAGDGAWARPIVATPSMNTAWSRLCVGRRRPANGLGGVVFGTTTAADERTRVAGVGLVLQWESLSSLLDSVPRLETMTMRSDSTGNYAFCGVQEVGPAALVATSTAWRSDNVLVPADISSLRRIDLIVGAPDGDGSTATVGGRVVDQNGATVPAATVNIGGFPNEVLSGPNGRFTIQGVPTGSRMLSVRKLGYVFDAQQLDVVARGVSDVVITMQGTGNTLERVRIAETRPRSRDAVELEERRNSGLGRMLDSTHFAKYNATRQALDVVPGIRTQVGRTPSDFIIRGRGDCIATLWINGVREPNTFDSMLALLPRTEIAAFEVFTNDIQAPVRFQTGGNNCAVVVVWTKQHINARR